MSSPPQEPPTQTLQEQISRSPRFRRVATRDDLVRPSAVFCFRREAAEAARWFRAEAGRAPERLLTMDGVLQKWRSLPPLEASLQTLVYGERLRTKATRLAMLGRGQLLYASDPNLAATRTAPDYFEKHRAPLEELWRTLEDEESRLTLAAILRHRTTGDLGYLRVARFQEYFHPRVKAEPDEVVVDAGAFNGATSAAFARSVGRRGLVYAFEPGQRNRQLIRRRLHKPWNWLLQVKVVPTALSDAPGMGYFDADRGGSSKLHKGVAAEAAVQPTPITTLDEFCADGRRVDLISLDVEGAEPAVLAGAQRLITEQRPKLQISVYHSLQHLFELPLLILERYRDYALFLAHHDVYSTETDAYLIPRERLEKGVTDEPRRPEPGR